MSALEIQKKHHGTPWYKQLWPWLLIALPGSVVIASIVTYFVAISGKDSVLSKDYYRKGLAINTDLTRDMRAKAMGLHAQILINQAQVQVQLVGKDAQIQSSLDAQALMLELENLSFAQRNQTVTLIPKGSGTWQGVLSQPVTRATWLVRLNGADWRLTHRLNDIEPQKFSLSP